MARIHYFGDGYLREIEGDVRQSAWICLFNPSPREAEYRLTFYFEHSSPTTTTLNVAAKTGINRHLISIPEVHQNERFGAKIQSSEPGVVQVTTAYYGLEDKQDWYTRSMHSVICGTRLSKKNYYADALVIDQPGQRLKEPEWAFIPNPNPLPANVILHAYYANGKKINYKFVVGAERVLPVFMDELVIKNMIFGAYYTSDVPVSIQQTRLVEEEDRKTIRACFSVMARTDLKG
jgi:hypothetical protein